MERVLGLTRNTAGALSYVFFFLSGIFFFVFYKDPFVRFHALQSILLFFVLFCLQWLLMISVFLSSLGSLVGLLIFVLWLVLIYKAHKGEEWEAPIVGQYARKFVKK